MRWQGDAQPFLQADPPSAVRLSQTLGHASSLIMKARSPFVASHAPSRKTPVAPGRFEVGAPSIRCAARAVARDTGCRRCFSSMARLPEVTAGVGAGCPSFGGQRTVASFRRPATTEHLSPGAFLRHPSSGSVQASVGQLALPALVCFAMQIQSKVAPPRAWPNPSFKRTRLRRSA